VPARTDLSPARGPGRPARRPRARAHFERRASRAITNRHIFRYLASATFVVSLAAGVLVWLIDRRDFATLGDALWWSLVTLSTVGYGDIVPHSAWGRAIGSVVIVVGVTFLSLLTATITSYFVSADQQERAAADDTGAVLEEIRERLEAIERRLDRDGR
jgi:voltage-gated potassium channel